MLDHQTSLARAGALNICPATSCDASEYVFVLHQGHDVTKNIHVVTRKKNLIISSKRVMIMSSGIQFESVKTHIVMQHWYAI